MNISISWFDCSGEELCKGYGISWLDLKSDINKLLKENEILLDENIFESSRPSMAVVQPLAGSIRVTGDGSKRNDYRSVELFNISGLRRVFVSIDRVTIGVAYPA